MIEKTVDQLYDEVTDQEYETVLLEGEKDSEWLYFEHENMDYEDITIGEYYDN